MEKIKLKLFIIDYWLFRNEDFMKLVFFYFNNKSFMNAFQYSLLPLSFPFDVHYTESLLY